MFVVVVVDIVTMTVCTALKIDEALNKTACDGTLSMCNYLLMSVKLALGEFTLKLERLNEIILCFCLIMLAATKHGMF